MILKPNAKNRPFKMVVEKMLLFDSNELTSSDISNSRLPASIVLTVTFMPAARLSPSPISRRQNGRCSDS